MSLDPASLETVASPALPLPAAPQPVAASGRRLDLWRAFVEVLHDLAIAVLVCFFVVNFVAQAFRVQGTSMQPLLSDGERIIVNKLVYRFSPIERGDVVIFWYPKDPSVSFIKRVAGRPGDTVELRRGQLYVNNRRVDENYVLGTYRDADTLPAVVVPAGYYYVLGDHRTSSNDSRSWGEVPEKYIYGQAWFRFWPFTRLGLVR